MNFNPATISTISTVLGMINPALGLIGSVVGSFASDKTAAKVDEVTAKVQDAAKVAGALMPLVTQFAEGKDLTEDDVRTALAGMDSALSSFDAAIAAKGG